MLAEAFRHAKAIGAWGTASTRSSSPGSRSTRPASPPATTPPQVADDLHELMGAHRVWERFTTLLT